MESGILYDLDVIDNLGSAVLLSDKLTFLGNFTCQIIYVYTYLMLSNILKSQINLKVEWRMKWNSE